MSSKSRCTGTEDKGAPRDVDSAFLRELLGAPCVCELVILSQKQRKLRSTWALPRECIVIAWLEQFNSLEVHRLDAVWFLFRLFRELRALLAAFAFENRNESRVLAEGLFSSTLIALNELAKLHFPRITRPRWAPENLMPQVPRLTIIDCMQVSRFHLSETHSLIIFIWSLARSLAFPLALRASRAWEMQLFFFPARTCTCLKESDNYLLNIMCEKMEEKKRLSQLQLAFSLCFFLEPSRDVWAKMVESIKMQFLMILTDVLQQRLVQTEQKKAKKKVRLIGSRLRFVMAVHAKSFQRRWPHERPATHLSKRCNYRS